MYKFPRSGSLFAWYFILFIVICFIIFLHLYLLIPGVDAGMHMYGSFLITKGLLPYKYLWNNKPPLIYIIGTIGFLVRSNPFLGVRLVELSMLLANLILLYKILNRVNLKPLIYLVTFSIIYLVCWDEGFLTETFTIPVTLTALYILLLKIKNHEFIISLLLVLSFLLKQNA